MNKTILITGGAGFIGSHVVRLFVKQHPDCLIINLDNLTYAGNLENLRDIEKSKNYSFIRADIADAGQVDKVIMEHKPDVVIHLAAESHVDRSIMDPLAFLYTNIAGTANLLNSCRKTWKEPFENNLFLHISTDEVFGSLGKEGFFTETTRYDPRSPYSASKAGSDHMVKAYWHTYKIPVIISNCSNNYGPNQFPEKLIPLAINNIRGKKPVPVYGKGENIRDWLFVVDHAKAIELIYRKGKHGETYNIGGNNEWKNIDLIHLLCDIMDQKLNREKGESAKLITFVKDRAGHDIRYAIDSSKIRRELGWKPSVNFKEGLELTVDWYLNNPEWLEHVLTGEYEKYYEKQYLKR